MKDSILDHDKPVIMVRRLEAGFPGHSLYNGFDLDIFRGEIFGVVGPSGIGKSLLLRILVGLHLPWEGDLSIFDTQIQGVDDESWAPLRQRFGILFQDGALFSSLSVRDNIAVPLREIARLPPDLVDDIVRSKLHLVDLAPSVLLQLPSQLSGGMRKRAALARAVALDPELLFLDEPTAGLDPIRAHSFQKLILSLHAALNLTIVMVTHDIHCMTALCSRIGIVNHGKIDTGHPEQFRECGHPFFTVHDINDRLPLI